MNTGLVSSHIALNKKQGHLFREQGPDDILVSVQSKDILFVCEYKLSDVTPV